MKKYLEDCGRVQFNPVPDAEIVFFAGAGISAESGLSTFRDKGGLWTKYDMSKLCSMNSYNRYRQEVFDFYNELKDLARDAQPNEAHKAIAALQAEFHDRVAIVTSNVDDLFEKAGCTNVLHPHGDFEHMTCTHCFHRLYIGQEKFILDDEVACTSCGRKKKLKPGVVFFGESAFAYQTLIDQFAKESVTDRVIIGTTLQVITPEFFSLDFEGIRHYLDKFPNESALKFFDNVVRENATVCVPKVVEQLREKLLKK